MGDTPRSAAAPSAPSRRALLTGRAPTPPPAAPPPSLRNLYGLLPGAGIPTADPNGQLAHWDQLHAQDEAQREAGQQALYERIGSLIPDLVKRGAAGAYQGVKDTVAGAFTPTPEIEALRGKLKSLTAEQGDPIAGPAANFLIDQAADSTTPGDAALNLLPAAKAAGATGHMLAAVPPTMLGGYAPRGTLAAGLRHVDQGRYALEPDVLGRFAHLYDQSRGLHLPASWESAQGEQMMRAFDDDEQLAHLWARMFGATSAGTDVRKNTKESVATLAHHLEDRSRPFELHDIPGEFQQNKNKTRYLKDEAGNRIPVQGSILYGNRLTNAPSKVPNLNRILQHEPMSGDKVEAMGQFMWGDPRTPLDRHVLWGAGANKDKFAEEIAALKEMMKQHEGLKVLSNSKVYRRYEDALREGLQGLDPNRAYNPLFADVWEAVRREKGDPWQGGPVDLFRSRNLLERGALRDPERLIRVLGEDPGTSWIGQPPPVRSSIIVP